MAQLHFTLDSDFFVGLFSETKDEAFGKLMEALLNQVLQAESTEQLGASNYERSQERSDYRNGVRTRTLTTRIGKIELQAKWALRAVIIVAMVFGAYDIT